MSCAFHQAMPAEISEVLGNFRLRDIENFLEMADAKRTTCQQVDDPQPRGIAETLVDPNQFHVGNMAFSTIFVNRYIHYGAYIRAGADIPLWLSQAGFKSGEELSTEATCDIVFRLFLGGLLEYIAGGVEFDELA